MANLLDQFEAAFADAPSPPRRETPLPRLPPKQPVAIEAKHPTTGQPPSPIRKMDRPVLVNVANSQELGMITSIKHLPNDTVGFETTLTTVEVRGDLIVRGRIDGRALYGTKIAQSSPFAP